MKLNYLMLFVLSTVLLSCEQKTKKPDLSALMTTEVTSTKGLINSISSDFEISGIYPHLTTYTHANVSGHELIKETKQWECGIGALTVWNDKLYMINYGAHNPHGSEHKLYVVDKDLKMNIFEGSVGGTPACRMVHQESKQLFIGHYVIDEYDKIRVIDIEKMPGRMTAVARHLKDPESLVYYYDMEGALYEVNVNTLEPKLLFKNPLPGWHGKGGYASQGKLVLTNNGSNKEKYEPVEYWKIDTTDMNEPEMFGIIAEYDGENFSVVERKQFTDVTTRNGVNAVPNEQSPLWSMGWDKRSVRLKVLDQGTWKTYLLPKATYNNDPSHGWFTEWPRIREIQPNEYMMDMHGMFYQFPAHFSHANTSGIRPMGSHLRYIPDFTYWGDQVILSTDELTIQGNPLAGQPQSNLWFGSKDKLSQWGPASGYGSIWLEDQVRADVPSLPYLFDGFDRRVLHLDNFSNQPVEITIELDLKGNGNWTTLERINIRANGYAYHIFEEALNASWIRLVSNKKAKLTATLHYTDETLDPESGQNNKFEGIVRTGFEGKQYHAKVYPNQTNFDLTVFSGDIKNNEFHNSKVSQLDKYSLTLSIGDKDSAAVNVLENHEIWKEDAASVIIESKEGRLRLPKGIGKYSPNTIRNKREVQSERVLANIHGSFYEVPLYKVGEEPKYNMIRPVSTHNRLISDFVTWNGMLVLSGLAENAPESKHVLREGDGSPSLWIGGIDDIWHLGKPVGEGGVWKDTEVTKDVLSDKYLMKGYDQKEVQLIADQDVNISLYVYHTHYSDKASLYKTFSLKAGEKVVHQFPKGFSTNWISAQSDQDCKATVWFSYK